MIDMSFSFSFYCIFAGNMSRDYLEGERAHRPSPPSSHLLPCLSSGDTLLQFCLLGGQGLLGARL